MKPLHLVIFIVLSIMIDQIFAVGTEDEFEIELKNCGCKRKLKKISDQNSRKNILFNETTCSIDAYNRGTGQKIVGFSLYGDYTLKKFKIKGFLEGILGNLKLMPKYYPGWIMRLYTDYDTEDPIYRKLCNLACHHSNLDICHVKDLPGTPFSDASKFFPMNWRFFPTMDPQVDLYVSRDLDSRFSEREHLAVQEWLKSDKSIHVMRDHVDHDFSMVGCSWGTKLLDENVKSQWKMAWKKGQDDSIMYANQNLWGPDQKFLHKYVWPWAEKNSIGHDSYYCLKYNHNTKPFPTQRKNGPNNFVGAIVAYNETVGPCLSYEKCQHGNHNLCSCTCN